MLFVTLSKLIILTCLAGLLGPYTFLAIVLIFLVDFIALSIFCKKRRTSQFDPENIPLLEFDSGRKNNRQTTEEEEGEEEFFFFHCGPLFRLGSLCSGGPNSKDLPSQRINKPCKQRTTPRPCCWSGTIWLSRTCPQEAFPPFLL